MADAYKIIDSKKYMWDSVTCETEALAQETKAKYESDGFETAMVQEDGVYLLYTRRVAEAAPTEGAPAP